MIDPVIRDVILTERPLEFLRVELWLEPVFCRALCGGLGHGNLRDHACPEKQDEHQECRKEPKSAKSRFACYGQVSLLAVNTYSIVRRLR